MKGLSDRWRTGLNSGATSERGNVLQTGLRILIKGEEGVGGKRTEARCFTAKRLRGSSP